MFKFVEGIFQLKTFTSFWIVFAQHPIRNWPEIRSFQRLASFFCSSELSLLFRFEFEPSCWHPKAIWQSQPTFCLPSFETRLEPCFSDLPTGPGPYYKNKPRLSRAYFCQTLNKNFRGSWANLERFDFGLFSLSTQVTTWLMGPKRILHSLVVWKTLDLLKLELLTLKRIWKNWMDVLPASFFKV